MSTKPLGLAPEENAAAPRRVPRRRAGPCRLPRPRMLVLLLALVLLGSSCAFYNTFYLARKYYFKATAGEPYLVDKPAVSVAADLGKSIDFSKKVMANYPKSKWVDDAYLLWARALLGRDDPIETVNMLRDFDVRFPQSDVRQEALFFLGVGYRQSRRYGEAEQILRQFLEQSPRSPLVPFALLERARALAALDRDSAAAYCAGQVLDRFPRSRLGPQALAERAEALLASGEVTRARADFQALGLEARNDEERLKFLLREVDCLEAGRDYDGAMSLLREALGHEVRPVIPEGEPAATAKPTGGSERYGRILMRIGTVHLVKGDQKAALEAYQDVVRLYPRSTLSAEAQYRVGYTYETLADDFANARLEYARVKDESPNSAFVSLAQSRLTALDRVAQFRTAGGDTVAKQAEAGFLMAEIYLFQQNKPERALEEYRKVAGQFAGTPWAAKALTAQAWVLDRKLARKAEADSLFWVVVREYPATEAQLAARDYLERDGETVPDTLIRLPEKPLTAPTLADTMRLTPTPREPIALHPDMTDDTVLAPIHARAEQARRGQKRGFMRVESPKLTPRWDPRYSGSAIAAPGIAGDSPFTGSMSDSLADSSAVRRPAPPGSRPPASPDSLRGAPPGPAPRDTLSAPSKPAAAKPAPSDTTTTPTKTPAARDTLAVPPDSTSGRP